MSIKVYGWAGAAGPLTGAAHGCKVEGRQTIFPTERANDMLDINRENLTRLIEGVAAGASGPEGVTRLSFTPAYRAGAEYLKGELAALGLAVVEDSLGTIYARLEGTDPEAKAVLTGSHLDSVRQGGKYDGIAGIVCAMEAVRAIAASGESHRRPIEVLVAMEEESCRFFNGMLSSRSAMGLFDEAEWEGSKDADGVSLCAAAAAYLAGRGGIVPHRVRKDELQCFVELHLEQGPILERAGADIGVVTAIVALQTATLTVRGTAAHAGTTPMGLRADPFVALSRMVAAATDAIAQRQDGAVVTFGQVKSLPGSANVVPYEASATVDLRCAGGETLAELHTMIEGIFAGIAAQSGVSCTLEVHARKADAAMNADIRGLIQESAEACGLSWMDIPSGAGHDAMQFAAHIDTAMIFIPTRDGRSHCKEEFASGESLEAGARVLAETVLKLAR